MKKKFPPARTPLPKFRTDEEAASFFETHSVADSWDEFPEAKPAKLSKSLEKHIKSRHVARKSAISIRLDPKQIADAKRIAAAKSVGYQTQLRMWIAEGIRREARRA